MTMTIIALSVVHLAGITCFFAEIMPETGIQYGALGLCAFMVYFLCSYITKKEEVYAKERAEITKYLHRLSVILGDRPCLLNDRKDLDSDSIHDIRA